MLAVPPAVDAALAKAGRATVLTDDDALLVYNGRMFALVKKLLIVMHNARGYLFDDTLRLQSYGDFVDARAAEPGGAVDLDGAVEVTAQYPQYSDAGVHIRFLVASQSDPKSRFGANARTRRRLDAWAAAAPGGTTRMIVVLVPTLQEMTYGGGRLPPPPPLTRRVEKMVAGIAHEHGLTIELLSARDVRHMYRMGDVCSMDAWAPDGREPPVLTEKAAVLADEPLLEAGGEVTTYLEREDTRPAARLVWAWRGRPPAVQVGDWVPRLFGARKGDVVRYTRATPTSGRQCVYRRVV